MKTHDHNNRFPQSFSVYLVLFAGFVLASVGITITSVLLSLAGLSVLLLGGAVYGALVMRRRARATHQESFRS